MLLANAVECNAKADHILLSFQNKLVAPLLGRCTCGIFLVLGGARGVPIGVCRVLAGGVWGLQGGVRVRSSVGGKSELCLRSAKFRQGMAP